MLNILHQKINDIVPIVGIEQLSDGSIHIEYVDSGSVTTEQYSQVNDMLNNWPLLEKKVLKLNLLDQKWQQQITDGFITTYGWKLGLSNNDVSLLTGAFLLAKEAYNLNLSSEAMIIDTDGISHILSINDLTLLMLQYGQYRTNLSSDYANTKNLINQATSIEILDNITI